MQIAKYKKEEHIGKYKSDNTTRKTNREIQFGKIRIDKLQIGQYKSDKYESENTHRKLHNGEYKTENTNRRHTHRTSTIRKIQIENNANRKQCKSGNTSR